MGYRSATSLGRPRARGARDDRHGKLPSTPFTAPAKRIATGCTPAIGAPLGAGEVQEAKKRASGEFWGAGQDGFDDCEDPASPQPACQGVCPAEGARAQVIHGPRTDVARRRIAGSNGVDNTLALLTLRQAGAYSDRQ
jgi:hypothetical protein